MTQIILAHDHFDIQHLAEVMTEMVSLGAPVIRVYYLDDGLYQAIEGCHRLRAAAALGIIPDFDEVEPDTIRSDVDGLDYDDGSDPSETRVGSIGDMSNTQLSFLVNI